jgi:hypothetical protein
MAEEIKKNNDTASAAQGVQGGQPQMDMRELGQTGLKRFSGFLYEEFLKELTGERAIEVYKEMGWNDPTCYAILFAITMLCRRVKWFVEAASSSNREDQAAGEFLETCMNDMSSTWIDTLTEILSMLQYGYSVHEIVYKRRCGDVFDPSMRSKYEDGRIGWRKIPIRSQDSIYRWQFDDNGGIQGVEQLAPPHYYRITIPVEKMLLFRTTTFKNNPEGQSVLRGAYRSWWMKKQIENIEAVGVERDLAGLPMALVPPEIMSKNASADQKAQLAAITNIVTNIRRNAQEGVIMPMDYDAGGKLRFELKLLSTGGTRQFDTSGIINRYDQRMAMTVLADFMLLGQDKVGSFALSSSKTNLFATAIGSFLDIIADVFNRYAIPRLFALNDFSITDYPKIKHGNLGSVDLNELGTFLRNCAQSGIMLAQGPDAQKHLMEIAGLPTSDTPEEETETFIEDPSGKAGTPDEQKDDDVGSGAQQPMGAGRQGPEAELGPEPISEVGQQPPYDNTSGTTEETDQHRSFLGNKNRSFLGNKNRSFLGNKK